MTDSARTERSTPLQVLWAEDGDADQYLIRAALAQLHSQAQVTFVGDGKALLAKLDGDHPDLVVLDLDMPGLDGIATLQRIRSHETGARQPVAMFTGHSDFEVEAAHRTLWTAFVQKPIEFEAFVAAVGRVLQTSLHGLAGARPNARPRPARIPVPERVAHLHG